MVTRSRQLAAIMFTDIQGYTALMQRNEEEAVLTREKHRHIFNSITKKYDGRILQYYGDGTLSIFNSAIDAVQCGTEMQLDFLKAPSIPVRIGIHIGDIIFSEDEIIGDGVNVASRIESLAVPGSVFISDKVYDEIKNQKSLKTSLLKTFKLKNIERPTEVYAISNAGLVVPDPEDIIGKTEADPSVQTDNQEEAGCIPMPILSTKVFIPPPRPHIVLRSRLIEEMNRGQSGKLTLISAPPGFGKTTLVSEWVPGSERATAWLSLDEGDNDPMRFLAYLVAAFQSISSNIGAGVMTSLQSLQPPPTESMLTYLLNDLSELTEKLTLVLDDLHVIGNVAVVEMLTFLLEHMPPQMHLVITTREDPKLPLPRLRVRGQLTELRISDLRFAPVEAAEFLNQVMGLKLTADHIAILEESTEGWIAGLQLAALSMQGRDDIPGFIEAFSGDDRHVVDYLVEEVLRSQPRHIQDFLLKTSILERLSGSLCDALTDQEEGKVLLESLERGNLFVLPLDDKRRWYRYHHLFAEVLYSRLLDEYSELVPDLHGRASLWHEQNALPLEAIRHALAAKEFGQAAKLLELAWPLMNENCQAYTWLEWTKELPVEAISNRPVLLAGMAWASLQGGELEGGETRLNEAESLLNKRIELLEGSDGPSTDIIVVDKAQFKMLPGSIANARAYLSQAMGDATGTLKYSQEALELLPENEHMQRAIPVAMMGFSQWENGDLKAAYDSFSELMASFKIVGNISSSISLTFLLADIRITQGRLKDALDLFERSLQLAIQEGEKLPIGTEDVYRGISELHLERGDLRSSLENFKKSMDLNKQNMATDWHYRLSLCESGLKETQGDLTGALALLDRAESFFVRSPVPSLRPVAALRARIWLKQGRLKEAENWAGESGLSFNDKPSFLQEFEHLTLARIGIAMYRDKRSDRTKQEAMGLLEHLLEAASEGGRNGSLIEILLLQSLAFDAQDKIPPALESLERALSMAEPEGYVRLIVDEGLPMKRLLTQAAAQGVKPDYLDKLMRHFDKP